MNTAHEEVQVEDIIPEERETGHAGILQNFANAILHGEALIAPGYDGIRELSISNAAYLSQWKGNTAVAIPFDEAEFDELLARRAQNSGVKREGESHNSTGYSERWQVRW